MSAAPAIAFFDMDYTLLDTSSGLLYVKYLRQNGRISRRWLLRVGWWSLLYKLSLIDMARVMPRMIVHARGDSAAATLAEARAWFQARLAAHISPAAVDRIRAHQQAGQRVVLISASTQFAVQPVAEYLQLDFLCTRLEVVADQITGRIVPPPCYAEGKVHWARAYAAEHGCDLRACFLYTDSLSDRPLLEAVGHPIAVNPDPRLKRLAGRRGWPIEKFY